MNTPNKDYVAGAAAYKYPALGDLAPPGGAKVLLLTSGCICTTGTWSDNACNLAWSPLPRRSDYTYPTTDGKVLPPSGNLLLLTKGDVCVFGPWTNDGRYQGWAKLPVRDREKEITLLGLPVTVGARKMRA